MVIYSRNEALKALEKLAPPTHNFSLMITIKPASTTAIPIIQSIANIIWPMTFGPLMSEPKLNYMMEMMYSTKALEHQMEDENHQFLLAYKEEKAVAYCSYELNFRESSQMMMHKLYLLPSTQGIGLGSDLIANLEKIAKQNQQKILRLQVLYTNENALQFYFKKGFKKTDEEFKELGNGMGKFLDYVLTKKILLETV